MGRSACMSKVRKVRLLGALRLLSVLYFGTTADFIPQRSESSKSITMVSLPSEGGGSKVR